MDSCIKIDFYSEIKFVIREVLLSYPNFKKYFEIHTDPIHSKTGTVIIQYDNHMTSYPRKLRKIRYTTIDIYLIGIVVIFKEFREVLWVQQIKNIT